MGTMVMSLIFISKQDSNPVPRLEINVLYMLEISDLVKILELKKKKATSIFEQISHYSLNLGNIPSSDQLFI